MENKDLTSLKKGEIAKNVSLSSSYFRAEQTFPFSHCTEVIILALSRLSGLLLFLSSHSFA